MPCLTLHNPTYQDSRHVLIEWLIDVSFALNLSPQTLHLTVRHIDTFLSLRALPQRLWQLAAAAALQIASKTEESLDNVPLHAELHTVCGAAYPAAALADMEIIVLDALSWNVIDHTSLHFLAASLVALDRLNCSPPRPSLKRPLELLASSGSDPFSTPPSRPRKAPRPSHSPSPASSPWTPDNSAFSTSPVSCASPVPTPAPADAFAARLSGEISALARAACAVLDQSLYDPQLCAAQSPQHIAAAALSVGRGAAGMAGWPKDCQAATGLGEDDFAAETRLLMHIFGERGEGEAGAP